jgi:hypothetical protein
MSQLSMEAAQAHEKLVNEGYLLIPHKIPAEAIDEGMAEYAAFTDGLPDPSLDTMARMIINPDNLDELDFSQDQESEWHKYRTNHPQFAKPGGYTNRSLQTAALRYSERFVTDKNTGLLVPPEDDPKEYYHFHPNAISLPRMEEMRERYGWSPIPPEVLKLHAKFSNIHALARQAIIRVFAQLEELYPELTSQFATQEDLFGSPIRILQYHPGQGDLLAGGHTDKGLATIQIAESHVGFRMREPSNTVEDAAERYKADPLHDPDMELIRRSEDQGVFFISEAFRNEAAYPDTELTPLWHDVVNIDELNEKRAIHGKNCARWAIIFFTNSPKAGLVTKNRTHTEITA